MEQYAGLDVSLKAVSICVSDVEGHVLWRGEVVNEGGVVAATLRRRAPCLRRYAFWNGKRSGWPAGTGAAGSFKPCPVWVESAGTSVYE